MKVAAIAVFNAGLVLMGCGTPAPPADSGAEPACVFSEADQAWVERALQAWRGAAGDIVGLTDIEDFEAVFFSGDCVRTSAGALTSDAPPAAWQSVAHDRRVVLPDGDEVEVGPVSFTSASLGQAYFVMSTPTVWRDYGVNGGPLGLETLMVAVMLHEGSHVVQSQTYGQRIAELASRYGLPESFGDDSLQDEFEGVSAFAESVETETDLFFAAAAAEELTVARRLAREGRELMLARAQRWFVGDKTYWREGEGLWLTMEGSGQWVGYNWLTSSRGAGLSESTATEHFGRRSRWWSQNEGLAIALALDRIAGPEWRNDAFGHGENTIIEMLDLALVAEPVS